LLDPTGFVLHLRQFLDRDRDLRAGTVSSQGASATTHDAAGEGNTVKKGPDRPIADADLDAKKIGPNPAVRGRQENPLRKSEDSG
jgi:hypothetical protein